MKIFQFISCCLTLNYVSKIRPTFSTMYYCVDLCFRTLLLWVHILCLFWRVCALVSIGCKKNYSSTCREIVWIQDFLGFLTTNSIIYCIQSIVKEEASRSEKQYSNSVHNFIWKSSIWINSYLYLPSIVHVVIEFPIFTKYWDFLLWLI